MARLWRILAIRLGIRLQGHVISDNYKERGIQSTFMIQPREVAYNYLNMTNLIEKENHVLFSCIFEMEAS